MSVIGGCNIAYEQTILEMFLILYHKSKPVGTVDAFKISENYRVRGS